MSASTMHFAPEWMRSKHQLNPLTQPPSPPPANQPLPSATSTYSALASSTLPQAVENHDEARPFRYSKEELLRIYKEGAGKGGLGLEVARWEGVVREYGSDPMNLREMGEAEKKLFASSLNSDVRRRQSTDYLSPLSTTNLGPDRSRLNPSSSVGSPMRERFGKRRESNADPPNTALPKKQSLSSLQAPVLSPREIGVPSPRSRVGYTSNFDGILNGGDSWMAKRRASEASLKMSGVGNNGSRVGEDEELYEKSLGIKEEQEENETRGLHQNLSSSLTGDGDSVSSSINNPGNSQNMKNTAGITGGIHQLSLSTNTPIAVDNVKNQAANGPPGLTDLANIEWSYKDPTGTVQGPFRADLMQKWYNDGYFTPDLPMKRTHLDTTWTTVEQLRRRCESDRIFLTPLQPVPPGLSLQNDSPLSYNAPDPSNNGPYQPAPRRSLRAAALESYINSASNSGSPTSSFGGRLNDSSPEPFGGRTFSNQPYTADPSGFHRGPGLQITPELAPSLSGQHGSLMQSPTDSSLASTAGTFGVNAIGRTSSMDSYGLPNALNSSQIPWAPSPNNFSAGYSPVTPSRDAQPGISSYTVNVGLGINHGGLRGVQNQMADSANISGMHYSNHNRQLGNDEEKMYQYPGYSATHDQPISGSSQQHFPQHLQHLPPVEHTYTQHVAYNQGGFPTQNTVPIQTPWPDNTESGSHRGPGPFDHPQPTASNTVLQPIQPIPAPLQTSPWEPAAVGMTLPEGASPWVMTTHRPVEDAWKETEGPNRMADTVQVNDATQEVTVSSSSEQNYHSMPSTSVAGETKSEEPYTGSSSMAVHAPSVSAAPTTGKSRKAQKQITTPSATASTPASVPQPETPSSQSAVQKPAWQVEEDAKKAASISLREIQEAEAKKAEARRTAERERERVARMVAATTGDVKEEAQTFTASWGLPTSQAGSRAAVSSVKEVTSSPTTPASTAPVWNGAPKVAAAKKSMKEILEEEEKRKKLAATREVTAAAMVAAAPLKRLYADTSAKPAPSSSGGAWTTIGPNGKANSAAAGIPLRSPPALSPSAVPGAPRINGPAPPRAAQPPVSKPAPPPPRVEDVAPSHEFLTWLNDSLKGLKSSVDVEEIMNMLLSFPVDPDNTTREIISDLIYSNSTTMNGRHFADEFLSKRKADAITHAKNGKATKPSKPVSIADVVKAVPKATQPEWGFKVVNKKKKGNRS